MKKILAALLLLALVFGAAFAVEASVTVDLDADALRLNRTGSDRTQVSSLDQTVEIESGNGTGLGYDDSNITFTFKDEDGLYGGTVVLDLAGITAYPSTLHPGYNTNRALFDQYYAWLMVTDYAKVTMGRFTSAATPRLNSIIDEQHYGPMTGYLGGDNGVDHRQRTDHIIFTAPNNGNLTRIAGRDLEGMLDLYIGKFFGQDIALSWAVFSTHDPFYGTEAEFAGTGARFVGGFMDGGLKVNFTYRYIREEADTATKLTSTDGRFYRNNFGLYGEVNIIENLKLVVGYGLSLGVSHPLDKVSATGNQNHGYGRNFDFKDIAKKPPMYNGIDIRAEYGLSDAITLATHNNITFGQQGLTAKIDDPNGYYNGALTGSGFTGSIDGKEFSVGQKYFGLYDAVAAGIALGEKVSVDLALHNWLNLLTQVDTFDGKKNPFADPSSGEAKEGIATVNGNDTLKLGVTVSYAVGPNASARIGIELEETFSWISGSEVLISNYDPALGAKNPADLKNDAKAKWSFDNEMQLRFPIGITVKF